MNDNERFIPYEDYDTSVFKEYLSYYKYRCPVCQKEIFPKVLISPTGLLILGAPSTKINSWVCLDCWEAEHGNS